MKGPALGWLVLLVVSSLSTARAGERWSRQLTEFTGGPTVTGNDWIPLSRPGSERQAGARVLNYFAAPQQPFLDSTAQPQQHHFTFLNHQFPQSNRFLLQQPAGPQPGPQPQQELLEQPFHLSAFQRTPPFVGQTIQHPPPPPPPPQQVTNPFEQQFLGKSPLSEALIQDDKQQQQQQQSILDQPFSYQHVRQPELEGGQPQQPQGPPGGAVSQEEVQLLYVPVETLYNQQKPGQPIENNRFNALPQPVSPSLINDFYTAGTTTTTVKPPTPVRTSSVATFPPPARYTTSSSSETPVSRSSSAFGGSATSKPKPNQPPLALFLYNDGRQSKLSTGDALGGLKNINEIAVLDAFGKNTPKVFIGPSGLAPPKSYSRFDLPYLSSVDLSSNRANRKLEDLPFFVAPLSYKTPGGYSKISLPAPHVGSIVVRQSAAGNSLDHLSGSAGGALYTRPTAASNVQYYTPSTLTFGEGPTSTPKTPLGATGKPAYDADHYTSPTGKPSTSYNTPFNSGNPRHPAAVNEEYFNLAKTKKPTTTTVPPTTANYPFRSYGSTRQFDFRPMPEQKLPPAFYAPEEDDSATTLLATTTTTTTERPTTIQQHFEAERMRTHFREENFRGRRPHHPQTTPSVGQQEAQFVHKFKLVDSVRPKPQAGSSSVVDHGFLDFFGPSSQQQTSSHGDEMVRTTITTSLPGGGSIRNSYYSTGSGLNEDVGPNRHSKYVSTYYSPSTTSAGTTAPTTPVPPTTSQDAFFRDFEHRSKFFEREPKFESAFPTTLGTTSGPSYINKYRYETDTYSDAPRYSVEVITTSEPSTGPPVESTTEQQHYSIPSELPPISANLPGLVNALMDDQWSPKTPGAVAGNTRGSNFRKQLHRTTTQGSEVYDGETITTTTTRRPLQRGRRPHPSRTTPAPDATSGAGEYSSTRAPVSRSRSRYVPNNEERPASRGRSRSRTTTPRGPRKEEENLDYQRDVLKQNYPVIRPQGGSAPNTTPVTSLPPTTVSTTPSTTLQEVYEEPAERLISTTLANEVPQEAAVDPQQQQVTRKYSTYYTEPAFEPEMTAVTTVVPPQTSNYYVPVYSTARSLPTTEEEEEYTRPKEVIPLQRDPEPVVHSVVPLRSAPEAPSGGSPQYQPVTESDEKLTTAYGQLLEDAMELKKLEVPVRPRRPGLVSRQRDPQQTHASRTTTERTTTYRTTTPEPATGPGVGSSRTASGRRPAFVRRPSRLYATTTASPAPTTTAGYGGDQPPVSTQGSYTVRTKNRQDILRGRTRRPTTTTEPTVAATTASPEAPVTRAFGRGSSLRRVSPTLRSRQEQSAAATTQQPTSTPAPQSSSGPRFRIRERTRFNLQPQESQWSTKLNQNSFQPVLKSESRANDLEEQEHVSTEPEPEIVTAARENEMYLLNVSANYGRKESDQEAPAEDSTENSVPSFADLLNDVMKDFIDDSKQQQKPDPESDEKDQVSSEERPQRRPVANFRNNFLRKRSRSKVIDSFETAESQHINQAAHQVYNGPSGYGEPLKSIDQVGFSGKNLPPKDDHTKRTDEQEENTAQEEATVAPAGDEPRETETEEASVELVTVVLPEDAHASQTTTVSPTEEVSTLANAFHTTTTSLPPQQQDRGEVSNTVEPVVEDAEPTVGSAEEDPAADKNVGDGIFADVKKTISDLYEMAEHDAETEEMVDGGVDDVEQDDLQSTDEPLAGGDANGDDDGATATDESPSETQYIAVTAEPPTFVNPMGSLVIPTSVSNGITHETEICYRGRCIKTEDDKRKRKFKLN
ncbi:mucin-5AC [Anopheles nili]|uniref:mucin-5AC n=1 Tax=Anopheles nili TaxID=185578 RepID=UPI00237A8F32|nr:mucin-5AC [Anopheles nili]